MELSTSTQEALVCLLCYDDKSAGAVEAAVPADSFDPVFRELARAACKFRNEYKQVPGEHTLDLVEECGNKDPDRAEFYERVFESLQAVRDGVNADYVLRQANTFARYQRLKVSMRDALDELGKDDETGLQQAEAVLARALKPTANTTIDLGVDVFRDPLRTIQFLEAPDEPFETGIEYVDKLGLGPRRKQLHLLMGLSGRGKSWWLIHLAKTAVQYHRRILYVSLELGEKSITQRLLMSLFSFTKTPRHVDTTRLVTKKGQLRGFRQQTLEGLPALFANNSDAKLRRVLERNQYRGRLIVRSFSSLSVQQLIAHLDLLEYREHFVPDMVLIDYPDLMQWKGNYREPYQGSMEVYRELRALAVERNFALPVVTQSNRAGVGKALLDESNMGGDIGKYQLSDVCVTYNQTDAERALGLARLYWAKGRDDADKFTILVTQKYDMGQFVLDSHLMDRSAARLLEEELGRRDSDLEVDDEDGTE